MTYLVICAVALLAAVLTLFSGFGLGTLLMPAFALFFPVPVAIAATAVVHMANNGFKLALIGRWAKWSVVLRFGVPALGAAFAGAALLEVLASTRPLVTYTLAGGRAQISATDIVVAVLIGGFALLELWPRFQRMTFGPHWLILGGALSGFFGGLSGHQGALRSAFLVRTGLDRDAFVGTAAVCSMLVDAARLAVYAAGFALATKDLGGLRGMDPWLIGAACVAAFVGSFVGSRLVKKVTLKAVRWIVGAMLLGSAVLIGTGATQLFRAGS